MSVSEVMFVPGIGSHLKVSYRDPRVCFGNELTNLSVRKSFLPRYIKSSRPNLHVGGACLTFHHYEKLDRTGMSDYSMDDANRSSLIVQPPL